MKIKNWTIEEENFIRENYYKLEAKEIAEHLGRTLSSVQHKISRMEIVGKRWTDEEIEYLKNNYLVKTNKELSKELNRSKSAIDLKINRLGLVKSPYYYDHNFFENINNEEKAYWLGFIMADGCVTIGKNNSCELTIHLQTRDIGHLKKFNKSLKGNVPIQTKERLCTFTNKYNKISIIRFYSQKMVHDLEKYNVIPRKSLVKEFPTNLPKELMNHYIRGYFDGNGCITNSDKYVGCSFCSGSFKFIEGLRKFLNENGIKTSPTRKKDKDSNCYIIQIYGIKNCDNFLNYIYKNSTIYLDRKFNKKSQLYKTLNIYQKLLPQSEMIV